MTEKKPSKSGKAIGTDPFADVAADVWQGIGVTPEAPDTKTASSENTPSEKAALIIEIHDEADMALVAWLYQEETLQDDAPPPPAGDAVRDKP